jgi:hypothetical protein
MRRRIETDSASLHFGILKIGTSAETRFSFVIHLASCQIADALIESEESAFWTDYRQYGRFIRSARKRLYDQQSGNNPEMPVKSRFQ